MTGLLKLFKINTPDTAAFYLQPCIFAARYENIFGNTRHLFVYHPVSLHIAKYGYRDDFPFPEKP